jgi:hypothetical protein
MRRRDFLKAAGLTTYSVAVLAEGLGPAAAGKVTPEER